jgi:hypothetical protein
MPISSLPQAIRDGFEVHEWRHATAILETDFPGEWKDLCEVLSVFRLRGSYITKGGGEKSDVSEWFDKHLYKEGELPMSECADVVVEVLGGNVSQVYTGCERIKVVVVDWDNAEASKDASFAWLVPHTPLSRMPKVTRIAVSACQSSSRS